MILRYCKVFHVKPPKGQNDVEIRTNLTVNIFVYAPSNKQNINPSINCLNLGVPEN